MNLVVLYVKTVAVPNVVNMKLLFKEKHFTKGDILDAGVPPVPKTPWYLRILGFKYQYAVYVCGEPIQSGDHFEYDIKIKNKKLKWVWKKKF